MADWTAPTLDRAEPELQGAERPSLEQWLDYHRATLLHKCAGLTHDQLKQKSGPTSSVGGSACTVQASSSTSSSPPTNGPMPTSRTSTACRQRTCSRRSRTSASQHARPLPARVSTTW